MEKFILLIVAGYLAGNVACFTKYGDKKKHILKEEIVMEHDITIYEYAWMPFLKTLLTRAGFTRQRSFADVVRNSVIDRRQTNDSGFSFTNRYNTKYNTETTTSKAVFESVSHCQQLKKSIRRLKPILSVLIRGGRRQAKLLAKKFSTKLAVKRCKAILTVHCEAPLNPKVRAPRAKRV